MESCPDRRGQIAVPVLSEERRDLFRRLDWWKAFTAALKFTTHPWTPCGGDGAPWQRTKDGDVIARMLFEGHYSRRPGRREGGSRNLILGPGEKTLLVTPCARAVFGWRKFLDDSGQTGVCCSVFRNLSPVLLSSDLIRAACAVAWERWPGQRLYTFVNPAKVRSSNPGYCFRRAGWTRRPEHTGSGLLIFELLPPMNAVLPSAQPRFKLSARGSREDYERDVEEARALYAANPSGRNHGDLYAAKDALKRHWPSPRPHQTP